MLRPTARHRLFAIIAASAASVVLLGAASPGPWNDELPSDARPGTLHYVALGDSFSAGEGAPYVDATDRYQLAVTTGIADINAFLDGLCDPRLPGEDDCRGNARTSIENNYGWLGETQSDDGNGCHRTMHAYPVRAWGILDREDPGWGLTFAACSGAVTADVSNPSKGEPAQIEALRANPADIVTVGFGGNDIGFSRLITSCLTESGVDRYFAPFNDVPTFGNIDQCRLTNSGIVDYQLNNLKGNVLSDLSIIKQQGKLKAGAKVMVVGYPRLFPDNPPGGCSTGAGTSLGPDTMSWLNELVDRLNSTLRSAAEGSGTAFVDTTYVLEDASRGYSHGLCTDDGSERWVNRLVPSDINRSFHPKFQYHEQVAIQIVDCWRTCLPTQ